MAKSYISLSFLRTKNIVIREMLSEFIATMILVLMSDSSVAVQILSGRQTIDLNTVGIATGVGLMFAAYVGTKVSGGYANPAVVLGLATVGKFPWKKLPHYFLAHYLGAFTASVLVYANYYNAINEFDGGVRTAFHNSSSTAAIFTTHPAHFVSISGALVDGILSVGVLQFGTMCLIDEKNLKVNKQLIPIGLALLMTAIVMAFGLNCGPVMNPSRDISGRIFSYIVGYGSDVWGDRNYTYWLVGGLIGPHLGAVVGQLIYYILIEAHLDTLDSY